MKEELGKFGLIVNEEKTEVTTVQNWKRAQKLGSMMNTQADIRHRKNLALQAMNKLRDVWNSPKIDTGRKVRLYKAYVQSVLLYNSSAWASSKTIDKELDRFQRRMIRRMLRVYWPNILRNEDADNVMLPASKEARRRRLKMLGHVARGEGPATEALRIGLDEIVRGPGRPPSSLLNTIRGDVKNIRQTFESIRSMNRDEYRRVCDNFTL